MHLPKASPRYPSLLAAALLSSVIGVPMPRALAHQVEISQDIGGTLHIEPSDTPRAGEEVLAWFALTRKGGAPVALADCDCRIDIYQQPELGDDPPILSPAPLAVQGDAAVGDLAGIPGAKFTFPVVGAYTLVISGQPRPAAPNSTQTIESFAPFSLAFDVTVAAGGAVQNPTTGNDTAALADSDRPESLAANPDSKTDPKTDPKTDRGPNRSTLGWAVCGGLLFGWAVARLAGHRR